MVDFKIPLDLVSYGNERVGEEIKRRRRRRRTRRKSGEEEEKRERENLRDERAPEPSRRYTPPTCNTCGRTCIHMHIITSLFLFFFFFFFFFFFSSLKGFSGTSMCVRLSAYTRRTEESSRALVSSLFFCFFFLRSVLVRGRATHLLIRPTIR